MRNLGNNSTTIRAIAETILSESLKSKDSDSDRLAEIAQSLIFRMEKMPRPMAWPLSILIVLFDWHGWMSTGKRFQNQSLAQRVKQFYQWKRSPLGIPRDFVQFFEKMTLFIHYSLLSSFTPTRDTKEILPAAAAENFL